MFLLQVVGIDYIRSRGIEGVFLLQAGGIDSIEGWDCFGCSCFVVFFLPFFFLARSFLVVKICCFVVGLCIFGICTGFGRSGHQDFIGWDFWCARVIFFFRVHRLRLPAYICPP